MRIFVTGGTGTLGSVFVARMLYEGHDVVVYSRDEIKQHEMSLSVSDTRGSCKFVVGDIRDTDILTRAMAGADYVLHTAAMKMIDTAEVNPEYCIDVNVNGTASVIEACDRNNVERAIFISTDKASSPMSTYGASKLLAEKLVQSANARCRRKYAAIRFGNFFGSRGSVVPYFVKLVKEGKKRLPITHPDIGRYFITVDDAVEFAMNIFDVMRGGEIFIPKMKTIMISDLIEVLGCTPYEIGLRTNEKIHEKLFSDDEANMVYDAGEYFFIIPSVDSGDGRIKYDYYKNIVANTDDSEYHVPYTKDEIRELLKGI